MDYFWIRCRCRSLAVRLARLHAGRLERIHPRVCAPLSSVPQAKGARRPLLLLLINCCQDDLRRRARPRPAKPMPRSARLAGSGTVVKSTLPSPRMTEFGLTALLVNPLAVSKNLVV